MFRQFLLLVVVAFLLGGCAVSQNLHHLQMADMKLSNTCFDMKLGWNVALTATETHIDGLIKNNWNTQISDVELWVSLLNSNAETIARKSFFVFGSLAKDETTPFSIVLPVRAETGSKLIFTYHYNPHSGGDSDWWMQSFEANIPMDTEQQK